MLCDDYRQEEKRRQEQAQPVRKLAEDLNLTPGESNGAVTPPAPRRTKGKKKNTRKPEKLIFSASDDYRNITFRGEKHFLTKTQALIAKLLHEAYKRGHPMVPEDRLLFAIGSRTELRSYFRRSALWGTLVIKGPRKGTFQLNLTPVSPGSKPHSSR